MRYASKVAMCRVQIPKLAYDNNTLEFWYTGNGSATFDPAITTSKSTTIIWQTSDGQTAITTGTSHAFSYTPASGGPYRCTARVAGGLGLVTQVIADADSLVMDLANFRKLSPTQLTLSSNSGLRGSLAVLSQMSKLQNVYLNSTGLTGDISALSSLSSLIIVNLQIDPSIAGSIASFAGLTLLTQLALNGSTALTGSISDIAPLVNLTHLWLFSDTLITPGSIATFTKIRDARLYSMWPSLAAADSVDIVINSMWAARAAYTYASGPSMQIGGTNPDPTGNMVAPVEGADWHEDTPGHWVPLTPGAKIYDLLNDVNSEGFPTWTSIAT